MKGELHIRKLNLKYVKDSYATPQTKKLPQDKKRSMLYSMGFGNNLWQHIAIQTVRGIIRPTFVHERVPIEERGNPQNGRKLVQIVSDKGSQHKVLRTVLKMQEIIQQPWNPRWCNSLSILQSLHKYSFFQAKKEKNTNKQNHPTSNFKWR